MCLLCTAGYERITDLMRCCRYVLVTDVSRCVVTVYLGYVDKSILCTNEECPRKETLGCFFLGSYDFNSFSVDLRF